MQFQHFLCNSLLEVVLFLVQVVVHCLVRFGPATIRPVHLSVLCLRLVDIDVLVASLGQHLPVQVVVLE